VVGGDTIPAAQHAPYITTPRLGAVLLAGLALLLACCSRSERDPLDTVVLITVDATNSRILMGNDGAWETAPELWSFFDEATVFPNGLSPRGMTSVALTSLSTGTYPRDHGVRRNGKTQISDQSTLHERFQQAGYTTMGYSANMCHVMNLGVDERVCTWVGELGGEQGLTERDELLSDQLIYRLKTLPPEERIFLWLHFNQPHAPFEAVEEWYQEFHPDDYTGVIDVSSSTALYDVALGSLPFRPEDSRHLEAVYASQVRDTDARIGRVLDALREVGRWDEALVAFGVDHGEELLTRHDYAFHACSIYSEVLGVVFAFRAPGRVPQGQQLEGWTSTVDIAPTIVALADAFEWEGLMPGRSLVETMNAGLQDDAPAFFERGTEDAGIVRGGFKYAIGAEGGYGDCKPYMGEDTTYPGEVEELYDLSADPGELENIVDEQPELRDQLREELCLWVNQDDWVDHENTSRNRLLRECQGYR